LFCIIKGHLSFSLLLQWTFVSHFNITAIVKKALDAPIDEESLLDITRKIEKNFYLTKIQKGREIMTNFISDIFSDFKLRCGKLTLAYLNAVNVQLQQDLSQI
jgi:hypothetical protein